MTALDDLWPDDDRRDEALYSVAGAIGNCAPERTAVTPSELRALQASSFGLDRHGVAVVLGWQDSSVTSALKSARRALRTKNTTHAVAEALRQGLIL